MYENQNGPLSWVVDIVVTAGSTLFAVTLNLDLLDTEYQEMKTLL